MCASTTSMTKVEHKKNTFPVILIGFCKSIETKTQVIMDSLIIQIIPIHMHILKNLYRK